MDFESKLIPILREGVEIVKMISFKKLKEALAKKHPDRESAFIAKLAGALVNIIFPTPSATTGGARSPPPPPGRPNPGDPSGLTATSPCPTASSSWSAGWAADSACCCRPSPTPTGQQRLNGCSQPSSSYFLILRQRETRSMPSVWAARLLLSPCSFNTHSI